MSKQEKDMNRRDFLRTGIRGAGLVGLGSAAGLVASRYLSPSINETSGGVAEVPGTGLRSFRELPVRV